MKHLLILTIGICLFISVPVMADQAADEAAIKKAMEQFYSIGNRHDSKAFVALIAEDYEEWDGSIKGLPAREKYISGLWERHKDLQLKVLVLIGIVFISRDVAIYKAREEFTGWLDADGKPLPPAKLLSARVLVKRNGKWLFAAAFTRPIEE